MSFSMLNRDLSDFESMIVYEKIVEYIKSCNGYIVGDFINQVYIPKKNNQKMNFNGIELTFWFKTQSEKEDFVRKMKYNLKFDENKTYITYTNTDLVEVVFYVSPIYPLNDFDIDRLILNPRLQILGEKNNRVDDIPELEKKIMNKEATLTQSYLDSMVYHGVVDHRVQQFLNQGWKVYLPNKIQINKGFTQTWLIENMKNGAGAIGPTGLSNAAAIGGTGVTGTQVKNAPTEEVKDQNNKSSNSMTPLLASMLSGGIETPLSKNKDKQSSDIASQSKNQSTYNSNISSLPADLYFPLVKLLLDYKTKPLNEILNEKEQAQIFAFLYDMVIPFLKK